MDMQDVQRFREHEADDCPDSDDYARDCESEAGRDLGWLGLLLLVASAVVSFAIIAAIWPH